MAGYRHGRERRIVRRADFVRIQRDGKPVRTRSFTLLLLRRVTEGPARLGVVTSRKVGGAVVRNRIRRICRECFRLHPDFLPDGIDLVVIPRTGAHLLSPNDVWAEWSGASGPIAKRCKEALAEPLPQPQDGPK